MLEQLMKLVQQHAGESIVNNPNVPNEHNQAAIETATNGIFSGLQEQISGGNVANLLQMFQNGGGQGIQNNGVVSGIAGNVANQLMQKFGISNGVAQGIVSSLIPTVMNSLVSKTNNPNDSSFDLQGIVQSLAGGGAGQQGGGFDMSSVMNLIGGMAGGNNSNAEAPQQGGLGGLIGNLFGKK